MSEKGARAAASTLNQSCSKPPKVKPAVCAADQAVWEGGRGEGMAHLYRDLSVKSLYTDRTCEGGNLEWQRKIERSTTLYIGNLSFYTTEEQLYEFFGMCGEVKRVVMGLDRHNKTPCGFCFVEYHHRSDTEDAVRFLGGCKLDDRIVRVDWDGGFEEGRQYGRGRSGGQVREEYRTDFDAQRGGWGHAVDTPPVIQQPRRRTFDSTFKRYGGDGDGGSGGASLPSSAPKRQSEPISKRSKVDTNPRFREDKEEDDDDD